MALLCYFIGVQDQQFLKLRVSLY